MRGGSTLFCAALLCSMLAAAGAGSGEIMAMKQIMRCQHASVCGMGRAGHSQLGGLVRLGTALRLRGGYTNDNSQRYLENAGTLLAPCPPLRSG